MLRELYGFAHVIFEKMGGGFVGRQRGFLCMINSDEHSAVAVCEERERAADGDRAKRRAVGVLHLNAATPGKQGRVCERSEMEESASEPKCSGDEQSRPFFMSAGPEGSCIFTIDIVNILKIESKKSCFSLKKILTSV
jgi:hypothetical protein